MPSEAASDWILLPDIAATHALASELAARLGPGCVLALVGDLGAGKTEFTRGLVAARGAGAEVRVCSPSYLLLNLYDTPDGPVAHFDAYFMNGPDDLERAGLHDLLRDGALVVVEWADRVESVLPPDSWRVELESGPGGIGRRARVTEGRSGAHPRP